MNGKVVSTSKMGGGQNKWLVTVEVDGGQSTENVVDAGNPAASLRKDVVGSRRTDVDVAKLLDGKTVHISVAAEKPTEKPAHAEKAAPPPEEKKPPHHGKGRE